MTVKVVVIKRQGPSREDEIELVKAAGGKVFVDRSGQYYSLFREGVLPVAQGTQALALEQVPAGWVEV